jgi:bis(5'-nucleosyl)-tetraphosphatase (symmetrical)
MTVYAIGDVQGCYTTLLTFLDTIAFDRQRDRLWFTGDLVNRGPQSLEVLRLVKGLGDRAVTVLGNHDLHLLAVAYGRAHLKPKDTFADVLEAPDRDALLVWLRHRPLLHHDASLGMTMVHAGLPPQWTLTMAQAYAAEIEAVLHGPSYLALLEQLDSQLSCPRLETMQPWERRGYIINCLTRLRYCDAAGRLALGLKGPPGTQPAPYMPWFTIPERAHGELAIVFGHWSTLGACDAPGIYAVDTGCVWGGALTGLCLETRERVSVPCRNAVSSAAADLAP